MAQRKSGPPGKPPAGKPTGSKPTAPRVAGAKAGGTGAKRTPGATAAPKVGTVKAGAANAGGAKTGAARPAARPPARKHGKSIVNQKQTPWGLIITTAAIVLFAAAIIVVVIATKKSDTQKHTTTTAGGQQVDPTGKDTYRRAALPAAMTISGVTYRVEGEHNHVTGNIKYDATPPVGGNHNAYWADCTGTVYSAAIANENAVHMLEHGAIWITYNPKTLPASGLVELTKYAAGVDHLALSPYPNLKTPISMQSWGYQLFVKDATDPRIAQFIAALKYNNKTTPEYGATCSQPTFKQHPSTFGHPSDG